MKLSSLFLVAVFVASASLAFADDQIAEEAELSSETGEPQHIDMKQEQISEAKERQANNSLDHEVNSMEGPASPMPQETIVKEDRDYSQTLNAAQPPAPKVEKHLKSGTYEVPALKRKVAAERRRERLIKAGKLKSAKKKMMASKNKKSGKKEKLAKHKKSMKQAGIAKHSKKAHRSVASW